MALQTAGEADCRPSRRSPAAAAESVLGLLAAAGVDYQAKMDPLDFVVAENLERRHLTTSQRAAVAAEMANLRLGANQHESKVDRPIGLPSENSQPAVSQDEAADKMKVSARSVRRATAVKKADPEMFADVKQGKVSVDAAVKKVRRPTES